MSIKRYGDKNLKPKGLADLRLYNTYWECDEMNIFLTENEKYFLTNKERVKT
jgi:hypothetical protein